jgi:hypothetical protein
MDEGDRNKLKAMLAARKFDPYIEHIRFPHYKKLAPDLRIDFGFPITALVGANGTNKSSILPGIQGSPEGENPGVYWFSTIAETGARNTFIYGYHHKAADQTVEVLKTRVKKEADPDYWEPSRAISTYSMAKFPPEAIKVLVVDPPTNKVTLPSQSTGRASVLLHRRADPPGKTTVIVEDELAKHAALKAMRRGGVRIRSVRCVKPVTARPSWLSSVRSGRPSPSYGCCRRA